MSLPKIEYPIYNIEVPSLKKKFKFRPFLVKEEKILLMAKESQNFSDILLAVKQIINNCCLDNVLNFEQLAVFDLEYVFIKLRAVSVDNIVRVSYQDFEDNKSYDFEVDLNEVVVKFPDKIINTIKITDQMGLIMKYPPATLYDDKEFLNLEKDYMFELIIKCIDKIYDGDSIYEAKNYKKEEIVEFLESLGMQTFEEVQNFLLESPKIVHELNYKNSLDNDRKIVLSSLNDFFYMALIHNNLQNYYGSVFSLAQHHKYSISEIENMIPFERDVYMHMLVQYLKEVEEARNKL